jgi:hypothetical protein
VVGGGENRGGGWRGEVRCGSYGFVVVCEMAVRVGLIKMLVLGRIFQRKQQQQQQDVHPSSKRHFEINVDNDYSHGALALLANLDVSWPPRCQRALCHTWKPLVGDHR